MLTSITPLGERGRGQRWGVTVIAFGLGSAVAGAAAGLAAGAVGQLALGAVSVTARLALVAALLGAGLAFDLGARELRLPGPRRQVNEQWLHAYRGWVYGLGFGLQLGLGVATIVSTAAVYTTLGAAAATSSPLAGAAVGATFGAVRAATLLVAAGVRTPAALYELGGRLERWRLPAHRLAVGGQALLAVVALALAV